MGDETTLTGPATPTATTLVSEAMTLCLAWCTTEPHRVGEVALVAPHGTARLLGRGHPRADDPAPRLVFERMRPGAAPLTAPLAARRLSRHQLMVRPAGTALEVESIGRAPLYLNGVETTRGRVTTGDTIRIGDAVLFRVGRRLRAIPALQDGARMHAFGEVDADGLVGETPTMWETRRQLAFLAARDEHILILGASGTGKELAAQAIHRRSARQRRRITARSAATLPEALVDAELFGNMRGFPNPGMPERVGLVGESDGGTLFLDEIGELPGAAQGHLLRVLDRGEYHRLGESRARKADLRLVAATNRPPEALKHDLAARLLLRLEMPGLDDRRDDIPLLIRHLIRDALDGDTALQARFVDPNTREARVAPALVDILVRYPYVTHVRELRRLLFAAMTAASGDTIAFKAGSTVVDETDEAAQIDPATLDATTIAAAMEAADGQVATAARALGLSSRHALYRLLKKHGLK